MAVSIMGFIALPLSAGVSSAQYAINAQTGGRAALSGLTAPIPLALVIPGKVANSLAMGSTPGNGRFPRAEKADVCKDYSAGSGPAVQVRVSVDVGHNGTIDFVQTYTIASGQCVTVHTLKTPTADNVTIKEIAPAGYAPSFIRSTFVRNRNPAIVFDPVAPGDSTAGVVSGSAGGGVSGLLVEFTNSSSGQIGDYVWMDTNANGIQDGGEPGLAGATVALSGPVSASQTTGGTGKYLFVGLPAGVYTVTVTPPAGFVPSPSNQGGNPLKDSNGSPATLTLSTSASPDLSIDFGFVAATPPGQIGDFVWNDVNGNGVQDPGESGLAGVTVTLSGTASRTAKTSSAGAYVFTGLAAGAYTVTVTTPAGFAPSPSNQGGNPLKDSNGSPATLTLATSTSSDLSIDFGFVPILPQGQIGDFVWNDVNGNGVQDSGESGLAGVTVNLSGAATFTTTSSSAGAYVFAGLAAGTYTVTVGTPAGFMPSPSNQGGNPLKDSNGSPATVTLATSTSSDLSIDFGFVPNSPTGQIGDFVWNDINRNGVQDAGEPGIAGVTVNLSGAATFTTTTSSAGAYAFTGLAAGAYTVTVTTPAGFAPSPSNQGGNPLKDSNGSPATLTLSTNASSDLTIDFGFVAALPPLRGEIGDTVWNDVNRNGVQDAGEPGIAGIIVTLSGVANATDTTDAKGFYLFTGLSAGTYTVAVPTPAGFSPTRSNQGSDRNRDSNGSPATVVLLTNSSSDRSIDFGFISGQIGDFVWRDLNDDGLQGTGEPGIPGATVTLSGTGIASRSATTDANGGYLFTGLSAGTYTVTVAMPAGFIAASPSKQGADPEKDSNGSPATVTLPTDSSSDLSIDFGFCDKIGCGTLPFPDLSITKTHVGSFKVGSNGTYNLSVKNVGLVAIKDTVTVTDNLPTGLSFISGNGTGWNPCTAVGQFFTCTKFDGLAANTTSTITLVVKIEVAVARTVINCATVSAPSDATSGNNTSCDTATTDPDLVLQLDKRVLRSEAEIGDVVGYEVVVRNKGLSTVPDAVVEDRLPVGFAFVSGSAKLGARSINDPTGAPGPVLTFTPFQVPGKDSVIVTYRLRVGSGSRPGANVNTAKVCSAAAGGSCPTDTAAVVVRAGAFDDRGIIVGKVFMHCDCAKDALQNAGEIGIPGVRLYLEDGTSAITDVEGKYNFYNVVARLHVVKVDRFTLPDSAVFKAMNTRNALDGYSRFVDLKAGELHKADFSDVSGRTDVLAQILSRRRVGETNSAGTPAEVARQLTLAPRSGGGARVSGGLPLSVQVAGGAPSLVVEDARRAGYSKGASQPAAPMLQSGGYAPLMAGVRITDYMSQLPATPLRARLIQKGANPSSSGSVQVKVSSEGIPADGHAIVPVIVSLRDSAGAAQVAATVVTLEASVGRWMAASDGNLTEPGVQVTIVGGEGRFELAAPYLAGAGEVRATTPTSTTTVPVFFVPAPRPLIAAGLISARIDFLSVLKPGGERDGFEDAIRDVSFDDDSGKVRGGARGAALIKGRVFGNQLLTLSYDSERDKGKSLFRDIRPDDFYPVYGDAALREFDAQSRQRFFAQLDRGTSFTRFGDFTTTRADDRRVLSAYDRTMTGAMEHVEGARGAATFFASNERSRQVVDEFPALGLSGPYPLKRRGLVNSERVEIITRDRNQPSVILSRRTLTRFADYTMEPLTGRLILRTPVAPLDGEFNGTSIRVTYELDGGLGDSYWTYGGDGAVRLTSALEVGGSFAKEDAPGESTSLFGLNATARLADGTFLLGELARTENAAGRTGSAQRFELRHSSARAEARLFGAWSDADFSNRSSTFIGDRSELGGRLSAMMNARTRLITEGLRSERSTNGGHRTGVLVGVERRLSTRMRAEFGYRYAEEGDSSASFQTFGATPNQTSALRMRLTADMPEKRSSLFAEFEQDLRESDQRRAAIGGEYVLFNRARLYGRHEWISSFGGPYALNGSQDQQLTSFGIDADYGRNTQLFSEYRARDAFSGRDAEASIGVRNRWDVSPGVAVDLGFSRVAPLTGNGLLPRPGMRGTATSMTGGLEVTRSPLWKGTSRVEYRTAADGDNFFTSLGLSRKISRDWTFLGRTLWDVFDAVQTETRGRTQLGLAWRETDRNRWNVLARFENRLEHLTDYSTAAAATDPYRSQANIFATLVNWQPVSPVTLSGRYAFKAATEDRNNVSTTSSAQLLMGRGLFDLTPRVDAGVIGSMLIGDSFDSRRYGLGAEFGVVVMKNLRVAAGYNVFGFTDKDLNSFGTTRKGPYIELGFKFDEALFGQRTTEGTCIDACREAQGLTRRQQQQSLASSTAGTSAGAGPSVVAVGASASPSSAATLTPVRDRITDEAISGDLQTLDRWSDALNRARARANASLYAVEKATEWLAFARDAYERNDRSADPDSALARAVRIVRELESGGDGEAAAGAAPGVADSPEVAGLKRQAGAYISQIPELARAEVAIVRAGSAVLGARACVDPPAVARVPLFLNNVRTQLVEHDRMTRLAVPEPRLDTTKVTVPPPPPHEERVVKCVLELPANVHFALDKHYLSAATQRVLDRVVEKLLANPAITLNLQGNTDVRASNAYNDALSRRRVNAVRDYLIGKGVVAARLTTEALGETRLVAPGNSIHDHALNRRVEMHYNVSAPCELKVIEQFDDLQLELPRKRSSGQKK